MLVGYIISTLLFCLFFEGTNQAKDFSDILTNDNEINFYTKAKGSKLGVFRPIAKPLVKSLPPLEKRLANLKLLRQEYNRKCTFIDMKLNFFDRFEGLRTQNNLTNVTMKIDFQSKFCHKSVWIMFKL